MTRSSQPCVLGSVSPDDRGGAGDEEDPAKQKWKRRGKGGIFTRKIVNEIDRNRGLRIGRTKKGRPKEVLVYEKKKKKWTHSVKGSNERRTASSTFLPAVFVGFANSFARSCQE